MKATIVNTVENTTKVVTLPESANNLKDLKKFLDINEGQFFEGVTRTDLIADTQALPTLPEEKKERGYVFFVSPEQNRIKNGVFTRKECYAYIKENNLGQVVKDEFGRNFTQVATDSLNNLISRLMEVTGFPNTIASETPEAPHALQDAQEAQGITTEKELMEAIATALEEIASNDLNILATIDTIKRGIARVFKSPYSVQDIENMKK